MTAPSPFPITGNCLCPDIVAATGHWPQGDELCLVGTLDILAAVDARTVAGDEDEEKTHG